MTMGVVDRTRDDGWLIGIDRKPSSIFLLTLIIGDRASDHKTAQQDKVYDCSLHTVGVRLLSCIVDGTARLHRVLYWTMLSLLW